MFCYLTGNQTTHGMTSVASSRLTLEMYRYFSIGIGGIGLFLWYRVVVSVSIKYSRYTYRYFFKHKLDIKVFCYIFHSINIKNFCFPPGTGLDL